MKFRVYVNAQGYAVLRFRYNGRDAAVDPEQKAIRRSPGNVAFLGDDAGFSSEAPVVEIVKGFLSLTDAGTVESREYSEEELRTAAASFVPG